MVGPSGDFLLDSCMYVLFCKHLVNELNMFLVNAVAKKYDSTWINLNLGKDWLPFIRDTLTHNFTPCASKRWKSEIVFIILWSSSFMEGNPFSQW